MVMEKLAWPPVQGMSMLFVTITLSVKVPPIVGVPLIVVLTLNEL
jgi:hypothetical protein